MLFGLEANNSRLEVLCQTKTKSQDKRFYYSKVLKHHLGSWMPRWLCGCCRTGA